MNKDQFKGKTAIVTGAGSGIGRDLVLRFAQLGTHVIAVSQTQSKLEALQKELGDRVETICVDLADWDETEKKVAPFCKHIDYLVNNAGYAYCAYLDQMPGSEVSRTMDVNVKGPMNMIRLVAPGMKERKSGTIVNVSSVAGIVAIDEHVAYAASKAALDMVTKVSAKELGPYNIRVNSVNPTIVWTKMGSEYWGEPTRKSAALAKIPMGRFVEIKEVIDPILFLLATESGMISGTTMPIDGGYSAC